MENVAILEQVFIVNLASEIRPGLGPFAETTARRADDLDSIVGHDSLSLHVVVVLDGHHHGVFLGDASGKAKFNIERDGVVVSVMPGPVKACIPRVKVHVEKDRPMDRWFKGAS